MGNVIKWLFIFVVGSLVVSLIVPHLTSDVGGITGNAINEEGGGRVINEEGKKV